MNQHEKAWLLVGVCVLSVVIAEAAGEAWGFTFFGVCAILYALFNYKRRMAKQRIRELQEAIDRE